MAKEQQTVADIFRRAQQIRQGNKQLSYKELKKRLADEYAGAPFPPVNKLAIPEQDARAPEEDWSAGLPLILRGIQQQNWNEIANGIVLCLEQTENYEQSRRSSNADEWHDRTVGIKAPLDQGINKWLPSEWLKSSGSTKK